MHDSVRFWLVSLKVFVEVDYIFWLNSSNSSVPKSINKGDEDSLIKRISTHLQEFSGLRALSKVTPLSAKYSEMLAYLLNYWIQNKILTIGFWHAATTVSFTKPIKFSVSLIKVSVLISYTILISNINFGIESINEVHSVVWHQLKSQWIFTLSIRKGNV